MDAESALSPQAVHNSLRYSIYDGCFHAAMLGCGEAFLIPFAIFLHANSLVIGILASCPLLLEAFAQMVSTRLMDTAHERKRFICFSALAQAFSWLPVFFLPFLRPSSGPFLLLIGAALYFVSANLISPAWSSLMGDLVDPLKRGDYFGRRTRNCILFTSIAFVASGLWLQWSRQNHMEWTGFGMIFMLAMLLRVASASQLNRMSEPTYVPPTREQQFTFWQFLKGAPRSNFVRFVLAVALMQFSTNVAGPFFVLYLLRDLSLSYSRYLVAAVAALVTQTLTLQFWGRISDSFGNRKVLITTSLIMPLVPIVWLFSTQFWYIVLIQGFSGAVWAGFTLSSQNFIYDSVTPPKRMRCVAYYNVVINSGVVMGAVFGGWLNTQLPNPIGLFGHEVTLLSTLPVLFLLSGLLRMFTAVLLIPFIREVRAVEPISTWQLLFRVTGLNPLRGFVLSMLNGVQVETNRNRS